jgi:hypothetical protein
LGTWTIEASYQSAGKQKFKATFDVKEYGEEAVGREAPRSTWGPGLEMDGMSQEWPEG